MKGLWSLGYFLVSEVGLRATFWSVELGLFPGQWSRSNFLVSGVGAIFWSVESFFFLVSGVGAIFWSAVGAISWSVETVLLSGQWSRGYFLVSGIGAISGPWSRGYKFLVSGVGAIFWAEPFSSHCSQS